MQHKIYNIKKIRGSSPLSDIEHDPSYREMPSSARTGLRKYITENTVRVTGPSQQSVEEERWEDDGGESKFTSINGFSPLFIPLDD
jgi:hypothetical protein